MVKNGKTEIIERHTIDAREHLTLRTVAGDTFTIVKPYVSDELLGQMREMVREILDEDRDSTKRGGPARLQQACPMTQVPSLVETIRSVVAAGAAVLVK